MNIPVIDCSYDGIGDAVTYAWLAHSARVAGRPARFNFRRHVEVAYMLGITPEMATHEPGERCFSGDATGGASLQTKHEIKNAHTGWSRLALWADYLGLGGIDFVRPPYVEHPAVAEWAEKAWNDRDRDTGKNVRVLIFPETYWASRQWPLGYFKDLAAMLDAAGFNTVAMLPNATNKDGFPYGFYGMSLYHGAAMMARADVVIGCDSGPAHIAGTIGVPTLAVCGPTVPEIVFGHMPSVRGVTLASEDLACVGCHFRGEKGFRSACNSGCQGLYRLTPTVVYERVRSLLEELVTEVAA
jgi:hypothetical protein